METSSRCFEKASHVILLLFPNPLQSHGKHYTQPKETPKLHLLQTYYIMLLYKGRKIQNFTMNQVSANLESPKTSNIITIYIMFFSNFNFLGRYIFTTLFFIYTPRIKITSRNSFNSIKNRGRQNSFTFFLFYIHIRNN